MRLICPNCDAQYEVADDVIPHDGRDVQCSNCGKTWFQYHVDHQPKVDDTPNPPQSSADPATNAGSDGALSEPQRRELDSSVADILRQEAELESDARSRAGEGLESQPELGLEGSESDEQRRARESRERMARMRGEEPSASVAGAAAGAAGAAAIGSRSDLLPDIEEINSTLRSTSDRQAGGAEEAGDDEFAEAPKRRRSGFRRGFMFMIILALILIAIYIFAPQIAQAFPQADPYLSSYVATVDTFRVWLDGKVTSLLTWLDDTANAQES